jgi:hypothetical protein
MERPSARPARRGFWFDPRFAIGLVLIVASVVGVVAIVGAADSSSTLYAARDALAPGDRIGADDLVPTSARLQAGSGLYLVPGDLPEEGLVVTKPVLAGELVPASAVGSTAGLGYASLVITVQGRLPASVTAGSSVDVWAAARTDSTSFGPPSVLVAGATVVSVLDDEGLVVGAESSTMEVLVPRLRVARMLEAAANGDALSVVPTSIPVKY